jgi:acyl dehydratase
MTFPTGLYWRALLSARRPFDRSTRFQPWTSAAQRVAHDPRAWRAYAMLLGLRDASRLLPTWYFVLGQRAVLAALADRRFPFPVTGIIHIANRTQVEHAREPATDLALSLHIAHAGCTPAGHRIDVTTTFADGDAAVAVNRMSALVRCPDPALPRAPAARGTRRLANAVPLAFAADCGRRYARVSGDYNPIHLWPWSARLFGFRRPIAHGMYSAGRIAALLRARGCGVDSVIDVEFTRPAFLPSAASLTFERSAVGTRFELVSDDQRLLLRGLAQ